MARPRPIAGQRSRARLGTPPASTTTTVLEPAAEPERTAAPAKPHPRPSGRGQALLAGLLALALVALVSLVLVAYRVRADDRVETARAAALSAAQDDAVTILSYDYRHLDKDFAAARATLTGRFRSDYSTTTRTVVRPGALQYKSVVKAEVAAGSVVSATADRVVVLLFVNQTTTSTRLSGPRVDLNRVQLTLVPVDGRWLVSKVTAL